MAVASPEWIVLPHGPIESLAENLCRVEGDLPNVPVRRSMFVVRLRDGRLVIHNGMALAEPEMKQIEAWGAPSILIVPNGWHRVDARAYKARYPGIQVVCPSAARKSVEKAVPVDGVFGAFDPKSDEIVLRDLPGVKPEEGVVEVRSADGVTLFFNDLIHNNPPGTGGFLYGLFAGDGPPRHHRGVVVMIVRDRAALRAELVRLSETPDLRRILVAHGAPILSGAREALRQVAAGL